MVWKSLSIIYDVKESPDDKMSSHFVFEICILLVSKKYFVVMQSRLKIIHVLYFFTEHRFHAYNFISIRYDLHC